MTGEPAMTVDEAKRMFETEGPDTDLVLVDADNSRFLARNKGVTDDGKSLKLIILAKIVPDDSRNISVPLENIQFRINPEEKA